MGRRAGRNAAPIAVTLMVAAFLAAGGACTRGGDRSTMRDGGLPTAAAQAAADTGADAPSDGRAVGQAAANADANAPLAAPPDATSDGSAGAGFAPASPVEKGDAPQTAGAPSSAGNAGGQGDAQADDGGDGSAVIAAPTAPAIAIPERETVVPLPTSTPTRTSTPVPTATAPGGGGAQIGGCAVFPPDNPWNLDVSGYPVHPNSDNYIGNILAGGGTGKLHPDFGSFSGYGIPYIVVPATQPMTAISFTDYGDESDPGPYPIPLNAPIEGGSDRHVLAVRQGECRLYELFNAWPNAGGWDASSGAVWDLGSNALRPYGWTSADAAGLPILPGLARYDEAQAGAIRHALRFTVRYSQRGFVLPATHWASTSTDPNRPPMGLRLRLKASFDISGYSGHARVILQALKTYGMIVADNGSNWYISGATDPRWDDDDVGQLKTVPGSAFEVVYTGPVVTSLP